MASSSKWLESPSRLALAALSGTVVATGLIWSSVHTHQRSSSESIISSVGSFVDALNARNYAKVRTLSCGKIADDVDGRSDEQLAAQDAGLRAMRGNLSVNGFSEPTIRDSTADVTASLTYERNPIDPQNVGRKFTFHLEKKDDAWKVCSFEM